MRTTPRGPARRASGTKSGINDGDFVSAGADQDPLAGNHVIGADFSYAAKPERRRLRGLPAFVVTKGGEHVFLPGVNGLHYLADSRRVTSGRPGRASASGPSP
ncbi:hypothetical protein ABT215_21790 [Streptomyces sp900105755]|uniref:hypothetical protein n=1 Tax=Streptomyces sp. 900105755 TaxID=3154389 RepID=UPI003320C137